MDYFQIKERIEKNAVVCPDTGELAGDYLRRVAEQIYLRREDKFGPEFTEEGRRFLTGLSVDDIIGQLRRVTSMEVAPEGRLFQNPNEAAVIERDIDRASRMIGLLMDVKRGE